MTTVHIRAHRSRLRLLAVPLLIGAAAAYVAGSITGALDWPVWVPLIAGPAVGFPAMLAAAAVIDRRRASSVVDLSVRCACGAPWTREHVAEVHGGEAS